MTGYSLLELNFDYIIVAAVRLLLACVFGGLIGYEREHTAISPAGFRTHILVCLGASLVMVTSAFAIDIHGTNVAPLRLGAQVISGIGFLGAGAIIKYGVTVKGITTAASLWAVACIGIACGIGFYAGALLATLICYTVLLIFKIFEDRVIKSRRKREMYIEVTKSCNILSEISNILELCNTKIETVKIEQVKNTDVQKIRIITSSNKKEKMNELAVAISNIEGVLKLEY